MNNLVSAIKRSTSLAAETKSSYIHAVTRFVDFSRGHWTALTVERWRDHLAASGMQPTTVNKHLHALRYASRRIEALGVGADFARAAEAIKNPGPKKRREALALAELRAMVATCAGGTLKDLRDQAVIITGVRTGMRASELGRPRWENLNTDWSAVRLQVKGGRFRDVPLDEECRKVLAAWAAACGADAIAEGPVFRSIGKGIDDRPRLGKSALGRGTIYRIIASRARAAGIERAVHPHLLRHSCITLLLAQGVRLDRILHQTGQASLDTLALYATDQRALTDPVGGHLPSLLPGAPHGP